MSTYNIKVKKEGIPFWSARVYEQGNEFGLQSFYGFTDKRARNKAERWIRRREARNAQAYAYQYDPTQDPQN